MTAPGPTTATANPPGHRDNAFDLLRLLAALAVLVEHSWVLAGHGYPLLPPSSGTTIGGIGLVVFFLTSGYLILDSWLADPSPYRFAARRALRIAPLYVAVVLVLALAVGPLLSSLPAGSYFTDAGTWSFVGSNLLVFPMEFDLPGVFTDAPLSTAVNGALWTIPIEILCYLGIGVLGVLGVARRRWWIVALAGVPLGTLVVTDIVNYTGTLVPRLLSANGAPLVAAFALGMVVRSLRPGWCPPWLLVGAVVVAWPFTWGTPLAGVVALVAVAVTTLAIAFAAPAVVRHPTGRNDLSYGVYVLSYPIQQTVVSLGVRNGALVLLLTVVCVAPLAFLTWRYIERPMLRLKPRRPQPARHQRSPTILSG
jgi:peptidoglycan/LPS O-acetylase OafA/YrhL